MTAYTDTPRGAQKVEITTDMARAEANLIWAFVVLGAEPLVTLFMWVTYPNLEILPYM